MGTGGTSDIVAALEAIAETLADLALEALRDAVESVAPDGGATQGGRPETSLVAREKRLTRARRSVEKAAYLLREDPTGL